MALLTVRTIGDPVLRSKASPVTNFDASLADLSRDMHETMDAAPGVGLAAPQVGRPVRMFVFNDRDGEVGTLCNPVITWMSDETEEMEEGCLSIPGQYYPVTRAVDIIVEAQTIEGIAFTAEAHGYLARIFQHETDHLDGILFIDRLDPDIRKEAMRSLRGQDFGMTPKPGGTATPL